ncbi:phage holin family protein [Streptomyces millisiae]|uniref:Phage holin family protein n=1 Tax=Streptomyces millisiae TaxID=3075542 RepID=A0ABU2LIP0_9ACTN|nr:phage holin family protein [Streptomyces sp. DSM 44918]MDT0317142.1 phage holin family protein [Streptomyces sp. DSM 44918]
MPVTAWRAGAALLRVLAVWAVSTLTMVLLALLLPGFRLQSADGDSLTRLGLTAALGAGFFGLLNALVWPWLVRALLLVPALVLGLLVFLLNGSLLLLALSAVPEGRGAASPAVAAVVAAVMSIASSGTSTLLAVRDTGAQRRRMRRLAGWRATRGQPAPPSGTPGTVFLQLDGVGYELLCEAIAGERPLMPTLAALCGTTHRLTPWRTDWSSQTGASQLAILHGSNEDVPAFRWYEKDTGELIVSNRPSSAAELQRRATARSGHPGLLAHDGASRGNLFSGGADQVALVLSVARRGPGQRSRAGYFAYFSDPAHAARTALSFLAELAREVGQSLGARLRGEHPRVARGGLYPLIRAFATVVQRDVVTAAVAGDIINGRTAVYADLVAYDEVAHHSGPRGRDTRQVLAGIDRCVAAIAQAIRYAPRPYHLVLLSDHGQSQGETFRSRYGLSLEELVRAGCGRPPVPRQACRTGAAGEREPAGAEARGVARVALHRPEEPPEPPGGPARGRGAPIVLGSGNLGLISFPDLPGRASAEAITARYPDLLRTLADHRGIGFLLVHSERHGPVVLGAGGAQHRLATGEVLGADPLAPFGPGAADAVRRTAGFPHAADIMVNSAVDPDTGEVHAFEDQLGSHGGLGGEQSRAFLMSPLALSPPDDELVGAEAVHRVLRRWLAEAAAHPAEPRPRATTRAPS